MMKTMRTSIFLLLILTAGSLSSPAQSLPDKGSVAGNVYTNKTLGLTWEFPATWQVKNDSGPAPANARVLLELLPGGASSGESIGMIGVEPDHFNENSPPQFNDKTWFPLPKQNNNSRLSDLTLGNGLPVYRYDFRSAQEPTRYLTFLSGLRKGYGIDFVILANSASNLEEMIRTLVGMKIRPDWPANSAPIAGHVLSSDQTPNMVRISDKAANASGLKHSVAPEYPAQLRAAHVQGTVKLLGHIGADGKIKDLYILSGPFLLHNPAIAAVSQWIYEPYLLQGKPIEVETTISVIFRLDHLNSLADP